MVISLAREAGVRVGLTGCELDAEGAHGTNWDGVK